MSRRPRRLIWYQWFNVTEQVLCPVCCKNVMKQNDSSTWHSEHILRLSLGGTDTYPNLIPICVECNLTMGKKCRSTYEFMARKGKISSDQAILLEKEQLLKCIHFNPVCEKQLKNGNQCANLKAGKDELYCETHIRAQLKAMDLDD